MVAREMTTLNRTGWAVGLAAAVAFTGGLLLRSIEAPSISFYALGVVATIGAVYQTFALGDVCARAFGS
jgi:hypothetical protein